MLYEVITPGFMSPSSLKMHAIPTDFKFTACDESQLSDTIPGASNAVWQRRSVNCFIPASYNFV